jgi:hypothetical protein
MQFIVFSIIYDNVHDLSPLPVFHGEMPDDVADA